ncbi:MAG: hypothetical protein SFV32_12450 [Opitutaceae bacterium]|nr:hypothetical protein [Opitutaceae bacterium]
MKSVLSEELAALSILRDRYRKTVCLPRYTPFRWWECDVCEVTRAGFLREYEIKISRADFFADAAKEHREFLSYRQTMEEFNLSGVMPAAKREKLNKHDLLAKGDPRGPVQFWYVTPVGLIQPSELPAFAGLIELIDRGPTWRLSHRWVETEKVKAPRLHGEKLRASVASHMISVCYYRFHSEVMRRYDNKLAAAELKAS